MSESMRVSHRDAQTRTDDTQTCEECGGQLLDDVELDTENDEPLKVIINQDYTARIDELRDEAADDTSD